MRLQPWLNKRRTKKKKKKNRTLLNLQDVSMEYRKKGGREKDETKGKVGMQLG
jgi:hypothetical protein